MSLLRKLTAAFSAPAQTQTVDRQLAVAVLLLETARADFDRDEAELAEIRSQLQQRLGLDAAQAQALLGRAQDSAAAAVSLHDYVRTLNRELDSTGKRDLLRDLWRVALADGRVEPSEEGLIRQLAELLFVPHADFIRSRDEASV